MKFTEDLRKYATEQALFEEEKNKEFFEKSAEVYAKA